MSSVLAMFNGGDLLGPNGQKVPVSDLEGKKIALYFSAHWCPPCRQFTPALAKTYKAMKEDSGRSDFEFVFVSSDRDEKSFNEYRETMGFLSLPLTKRAEKAALSSKYGVQGIPTLITFDESGNVINKAARGSVAEDPLGKKFPWQPEPLSDLTTGVECNGFNINEKAALCVFMADADDLEQNEICNDVLKPIAEEEANSAKAETRDPNMLYFYAKTDGGVVQQIRKGCEFPPGLSMLILDLGDKGAYYVSDAKEITAQTVKDFVAAYLNGKNGLTRKQFTPRR